MATLVRFGLGLWLALAPALCCCHARWITAGAMATSPTKPAPRPAPACPHCAAEQPADAPVAPRAPAPKPAPATPHCIFCDGQGSVIPTDPQPQPEAPAFAGEWLPVSGLLAAVALEHPAFRAGITPSEWTGVDARSAALFDRHVLRC